MSDADIHIPVQTVDEARILLGPLDSNARLIRELHGVSVLARDGGLRLLGETVHAHVVQQVLEECLGMMRGGRRVSTQEVAGRLRATLGVDATDELAAGSGPGAGPGLGKNGGTAAAVPSISVRARTAGQTRYLECMDQHDRPPQSACKDQFSSFAFDCSMALSVNSGSPSIELD